ncbi:MAG: dockerin type I domain-containing protein [Bacillota bacterium]|nr:dockerin type I domain-containing protein [Bacillota bacterium]
MLRKKSILAISTTLIITNLLMLSSTVFADTATNLSVSSNVVLANQTSSLTLADMPSNLKSSIEWVWANRMVKEGSTNRKNTIFDQIYAGKGTLNYVVRWQSDKNLTLTQRKSMETMISRQINNWAKYLNGYDGWNYGNINVKVVGWACANASQILDKQPDEIIYTDTINDELNKINPSIPAALPVAPSELSRQDHFDDANYSYPGGLDKRFDMYLWGTSNFEGGAGGDWGQRVSDDYILSILDADEAHIIEHEMGHGFGLPDFYEDTDRPPGGFPTATIMWAGDSMTITDWDVWMLRYTWSQLKKDTVRFPVLPTVTIKYGDVNRDNKVNVLDYLLLNKYIKGIVKNFSSDSTLAADVNGDGYINVNDYVLLREFLCHKIRSFPVEIKS